MWNRRVPHMSQLPAPPLWLLAFYFFRNCLVPIHRLLHKLIAISRHGLFYPSPPPSVQTLTRSGSRSIEGHPVLTDTSSSPNVLPVCAAVGYEVSVTKVICPATCLTPKQGHLTPMTPTTATPSVTVSRLSRPPVDPHIAQHHYTEPLTGQPKHHTQPLV